jgi:hypothetical protein
MAAQYIEITLDEMEKFLKRGFRALRPKQGQQRGEIYFDLHLGHFVGIRIWTSIRPRSGTGAEVGADAIRIQLISLKDQGPLEKGKAPIVKRTQGWRNSLQDRIEELAEKYEDNDEFWENWAETRSRKGDPEREMREEERQEKEEAKQVTREEWERREEELGVSGEGEPPEPELPSKKDYKNDPEFQRCERMQGSITEPQIRFIRVLLREVDHKMWHNLGLPEITGFDHIPNNQQILTLNKSQGCKIIVILKASGQGRRYATEFEEDLNG